MQNCRMLRRLAVPVCAALVVLGCAMFGTSQGRAEAVVETVRYAREACSVYWPMRERLERETPHEVAAELATWCPLLLAPTPQGE